MSKYGAVFQVRLTKEQLKRWRVAGDRYRNDSDESGLSALIRDAVDAKLADKSLNVRVNWEPHFVAYQESNNTTTTAATVDYGTLSKRPYDKQCTNKAYHWRGPCRFCGGS